MNIGHHGEHSTYPANKMIPKEFIKKCHNSGWKEARIFYKKFHSRKSKRYLLNELRMEYGNLLRN